MAEYETIKEDDFNLFPVKLSLDKYESMLYFLSRGDFVNLTAMKESKYKDVRTCHYLKKVEMLNSLWDSLARIKNIKKNN